MSRESEALFRGRIYRVTGQPVVANLESSVGTARELHLASCRTLRRYPQDKVALVPLTDAEVDALWIRAVDEDTTTETLATEWPHRPWARTLRLQGELAQAAAIDPPWCAGSQLLPRYSWVGISGSKTSSG